MKVKLYDNNRVIAVVDCNDIDHIDNPCQEDDFVEVHKRDHMSIYCDDVVFMLEGEDEGVIYPKDVPGLQEKTIVTAAEKFLKVLSQTPYNNTSFTDVKTAIRRLIAFMNDPHGYVPITTEKRRTTMKDAIIKNGITYKVVRMLYVPGCGQESPCEKCDLARTCNRPDDGQMLMPCEMFHKGNRLAYFKKMI